MYPKPHILIFLACVASARVEGASFFERSYEYVKSISASFGPNILAVAKCLAEDNAWSCAKEKAGKLLDEWDKDLDDQRRSWGESADQEMARYNSGRSAQEQHTERPSEIATQVETALRSFNELLQSSFARSMGRKKGGGGGIDTIDTITISAGSDGKKNKMKKKKKKRPQKIQIIQGHMVEDLVKKTGRHLTDQTKSIPVQAWVIGHPAKTEHVQENRVKPLQSHARYARDLNDAWTPVVRHNFELSHVRSSKSVDSSDEIQVSTAKAVAETVSMAKEGATGVINIKASEQRTHDLEGRGMLQDVWNVGQQTTAWLADSMKNDDEELVKEIEDTEVGETETRGKKKKKKKAILKLLLLGAVAKAKIGLLLQILSAHLQVKFFLIALAGLAINIARFWLDLKKGGQPQKVIYYEHAQHQHHYEHEDDGWGGGGGGGGYWSRSLDEPKEQDNIYPAIETEHEESRDAQAHAHGPYRGYSGRSRASPPAGI